MPRLESLSWLRVVGARHNNLKDLTVRIPLARFVCVTGVSGSGKSSLVNDILWEALARDLNGAENTHPGDFGRIEGAKHLDKVINIDQSAIGRTPRSNPATYIKVFDEIRDLFASLPESRVRGYRPGRFSFNVATGAKGGGRCEACEGNGQNRIEMDFLADVWVTCPVCEGRRFSRETLSIHYKGKSIHDVLEMDVQEALSHFENLPGIAAMLRTLHEVGLDYIKLGQSSTTLSGGEAQRIKLARELVKRSTGRTLYLLDEPTTGLHFDDIKKLLVVLHRFVDAGNTVLVIEHNLDVIKTADWVIDLGPEGGEAGGRIVAEGTPEQIAECAQSYTGMALRDVFRETAKRPSPLLPGGARRKRTRPQNEAGNGRGGKVTVVGARQHNLQDITVEFPRGKTTVCCGPSGSGKSSFAIDTVYTEGQRRYVESLSSYARQFLSRLQPPKVDHVYGLSPSICIEQKNASKSPRSTVGTVTEIYDYMRVLWARIGRPFCPSCHIPVGTQTSDEIVERVLGMGEGAKLMLLAPIEPAGQESNESLFRRYQQAGYSRIRVDGAVHALDAPPAIDRKQKHRLELVVDRIAVRRTRRARIADSVEQALTLGDGVMVVAVVGEAQPATDRRQARPPRSGAGARTAQVGREAAVREVRFSQHRSCERCGTAFEELTPHHFSFNHRMGWCDVCEGLGMQQGAAAAAVVLDPTRSIVDGAVAGWEHCPEGSKLYDFLAALARHVGFDISMPWADLTEAQRQRILYGCRDEWIPLPPEVAEGSWPDMGLTGLRFRWRGFFPAIARAARANWRFRQKLGDLVAEGPCDACRGSRLRPDAAAVRVGDRTIHEVSNWPLERALLWFDSLSLPAREKKIAGELLHEVTSRLHFLVDVGLEYITLHRTASTLSGGESQRIQLASQIGTGLTGVLYVLDEPTIGLHPRDNHRLIAALRRLRDLGNTLLLVEHDREVIDSGDHVLDFGPGAGSLGGRVTAAADPKRLRRHAASLTGRYLAGRESIPVPTDRRPVNESLPCLIVRGARENNLQGIDVSFPLGRFICVTGVSGSGKSSLVSSILYPALAARLHRANLVPGRHDRIEGVERIDKVINVNQAPIGFTPTSSPATYTGVFDLIRELFAKLPLSKIRGYNANRFSFNRPGGRCEACEGMGQRCIEMHFLPDVWVECESCRGARYVRETLEVQYRGRSIAEVLDMRVSEALQLFESVPKLRRMLTTLDDVGLGYVQLGQPAPTLSGGEAQRVKLAAELGRPSTGKTLYILDEPTTGLHFDDLKKLLGVLHRLVDLGNTCICIEHNLDVIKTADWVIDLGPGAGEQGGAIVVAGTPEQTANTPGSHTGAALRPVLTAGPAAPRASWSQQRACGPTAAVEAEPLLPPTPEVKMPWELDGRKWHTENHRDHHGEPVAWEPVVLVWLVETIESFGPFAPTDWKHRSRVEIKAAGDVPWFCHFLTGGRDLLEMAVRVPARALQESRVRRTLAIRTLDERTDLPIYGQWERVRRRCLAQGWEEWRLALRDWKDVSRSAFRWFLKTAATAYLARVQRAVETPAAERPWLDDGEAWHLSQRSIAKGRRIRWKPATLAALVGRFRAVDFRLRMVWKQRTAVRMWLTPERSPMVRIVTNMARGLRVELRAPAGALTPTQVERLGQDVVIQQRPEHDRVVFWVSSLEDNDTRQLREVWAVCCRTGEQLQSA